MSDQLCTNCGYAPRWRGPHGTNNKLTMCEQCQRAYWREYKQRKVKQRPSETERTCTACGKTFPLTEEHFYLRKERGTFRRQCKGCYDKRQVTGERQPRQKRRQQPPTPAAPLQPVVQAVAPGCQLVKVLVVDRTHDRLYRIEVPVANRLNKPLGEARNAERLIAFYRRSGHVVVEV